MIRITAALVLTLLGGTCFLPAQGKLDFDDKFRQLEEILPTPNDQRTASGAPARAYWQQQADHVIAVEIDDENQRLIGSEQITYHNNSPDALRYLWLQLENNLLTPGSDARLIRQAPGLDRLSFGAFESMLAAREFDGGVKIRAVRDAQKKALSHTIVKTMMRIELPKPLASGQIFRFSIDWDFKINDTRFVRSRTGAEYFERDGNWIYEMAHWFPRMVAYTDVNGWQHKQFLGRGEFTLEFGNYKVSITAPADHIVASTGVLQNADDVLTATQRERLESAKNSDVPVLIVTPQEALENEKTRSSDKKTWVYHAENVRDFAFATSRKFAWDAVEHKLGTKPVMCMSYFPNEGEPLWSRYSTHAIVHTLDVYSRFTFDYPYPVAISVNGPVGGMEYPMICFNGPRPEKDGTYSERTKYGLISVIIHEVGHNYFPMIVNSDERQWTWMDEGLNTFVQYLAEQEWEKGYPSRRGEPKKIVPFMKSFNQVPIMTNSESLMQFGSNAYAKPATALNILRETIIGRENFDFAFKEYARRWQFKRPQPSDFFRSIEDASGIDLDWFWRGWFYSTDHVDIAITDVRSFEIGSPNPDVEKAAARAERDQNPTTKGEERNRDIARRSDRFPELLDFYNRYDELDVTPQERESFKKLIAGLNDRQRALLKMRHHFTVVDFANLGGLVMPIIMEATYEDGTKERVHIPAEIWRQSPKSVSKMHLSRQRVVRITLDPQLETADCELSNNVWPPRAKRSRFQLFKGRGNKKPNPMQKARSAEEEGK